MQVFASVGVPTQAISVLGLLKHVGEWELAGGLRFASVRAPVATFLICYYSTAFVLLVVCGPDLRSGSPALDLAVVSMLAVPGCRRMPTKRWLAPTRGIAT